MWSRILSTLRADPWLCALTAALLAVRILYWQSYPFVVEGDGTGYYELICRGRSSLLHASGYPFFAQPVRWLAAPSDLEPALLLRYANQLFVVAALLCAYLGLRRLVTRSAAFAPCLLLGVDTQLVVAAGTARPEFAQAALLLMQVAAVAFAFTGASERTKLRWHTAAGALFAAGYVTKFNHLAAAPLLLAPLLDTGLPALRTRVRALLRPLAAGVLLLAVFLLGFHRPTTGTFHLNLEHGWIYLNHVLRRADIPPAPDNGPATRTYLVLARELPEVRPGCHIWASLDAIPARERAPHRERWGALLAGRNHAAVAAEFEPLAGAPLPAEDYLLPRRFCPLYQHLGLLETEELLADVLWEGIRRHPDRYLAGVLRESAAALDPAGSYWPYLPVPGVGGAPERFDRSPTDLLGPRAAYRYVANWQGHDESYRLLAGDLWAPGARCFALLAFFRHVPALLLWPLVLAGLVPAALALVRRRALPAAARLHLLVLAALLGLLSAAAVLLTFRPKELLAVQPLLYVAAGLSLALCAAARAGLRPGADPR